MVSGHCTQPCNLEANKDAKQAEITTTGENPNWETPSKSGLPAASQAANAVQSVTL